MRKKQNIRKVITISIFVLLCATLFVGVTLGFSFKKNNTQEQKENVDIIIENKESATSTTKTDSPEKKAAEEISFSKQATLRVGEDVFTIQVSEQATVYDAMNNLMSEGKMTFDGKDYPGLGFFVTQINSLISSDGKNLMYYINGKEASLGVSTYVIKEGDIIEWKLK